MEELRKNLNMILNICNQNWVEARTEAQEKKQVLDVSVMFGKYCELLEQQDKFLREFEARNKKKKRRFF